jgi:hypothetical protein
LYMHEDPTNRRAARPWSMRCAGLLLGVAGAAGLGCSPGINWRFDTYERVHGEAQVANQLTFVYFRNWYSVECTRFEEDVLKQPAVLEAVRDLRCVPLSFDWDQPLAEEWEISQPPAFAIVDPQGQILADGEGDITLEAMLEAIQQAKDEFAPMTQPAIPP